MFFALMNDSPEAVSIYWMMMTSVLLTCIACYIIPRFLSKQRAVPSLIRMFLAANLLMGIVQLILSTLSRAIDDLRPLSPSGPQHMLASLILTVIWITYFSKSERVRKIFVH